MRADPDDRPHRDRSPVAHLGDGFRRRLGGRTARLLLTLTAGALAVLATPAEGGAGEWAWVAFAPWLLALATAGAREGFALGALLGGLYLIPGKWGVIAAAVRDSGLGHGLWPLATALVFVPAILPFALVGGLLPVWRRRAACRDPVPPAATAAALTLAIGATQSVLPYNPAVLIADQTRLVQVADLGGTALLCFVLLYANGLLAQAIRCGHRRPARAWAPLLTLVLLLGGLAGYGDYRLAAYRAAEMAGAGARLSVLAVQTNIPEASNASLFLRDAPRGRISAVELTRRGLERYPDCELVAWPEAPRLAGDKSQSLDPICRRMAQLADSFGHPLMLNCTVHPGPGIYANEVHLLDRVGKTVAVHRKAHLVPFYEDRRGTYDLFSLLDKDDGWTAGHGATVFTLAGGQRVVPSLCIELHDSALVREAVRRGGETIVHMAGFAAFGYSEGIGAWDLALSRLRAIEVRRPVVQVANRGQSGLILASGAIAPGGLSLPFVRSARCLHSFAPRDETVYLRWGETPMRLLLVALLLLEGLRGMRRGRGMAP